MNPTEKTPQQNVIQLIIENKSSIKKEFVLFGYNKNSLLNNFGNDEEIKITTNSLVGYEFFLTHSSIEKFDTKIIRVLSKENKNIFTSIFHHEYFDYGQREVTKEINLIKYMDAYQFQADMIDAPHKLEISANSHLSGHIEAGSILFVTFIFTEKEKEIKPVNPFEDLLKILKEKLAELKYDRRTNEIKSESSKKNSVKSHKSEK